MQLKNTRETLREFGKYVIQQARSELTRKKKIASGKLYDNMDFAIEKMRDGLRFIFTMEDYATFVDKGVSGKEKKYNTPFAYTNKKPPMKPISEWAKIKKFRFRDEKGRYQKGNYRSIGFVLQNHIYKKGLKPSLFFTRPFERAFDRLGDDLMKAFNKDIGEEL